MIENEVKILNIDLEDIEKLLIGMGAKKTFEGEVYSAFYDFHDRKLSYKKSVLRLRKKGEKCILTYKEPRDVQNTNPMNVKSMNELEIELSSFETAKSMLEKLGLLCWFEMRKYRISYSIIAGESAVNFDIDKYLGEYDFVPFFMEIECEDRELLFSYVRKLGFKKSDCRLWSFNEVIQHYCE